MKIPIVIINFNLLTWPKKMIEDLKTFDEVGEIIIFDNCSTYEPLLDWYSTKPCEIIHSDFNRGHVGPWDFGTINKLNVEYYVVSDPDMGLSDTPKDALTYLRDKLIKHTEFDRIGLSLIDYFECNPDVTHINWIRRASNQYLNPELKEDGLLKGHIFDTTFGIYNLNRNKSGPSCSTDFPYSVRHIPYGITKEQFYDLKNYDPEYYYYLKTARSDVSSFKSFVGFGKSIHIE